MSAILQFPTPATLPVRERGESAAAHIDAILRTDLGRITYQGELHIMAQGAKQIRDLFRALGWSRYFRITKGCWSLGPSIEWAKGYKPEWKCDKQAAEYARRRTSLAWFDIGYCGCDTCRHRDAQRTAVGRRLNYALNKAFHREGTRTVGDHSDSMTDYFDADYTFHP